MPTSCPRQALPLEKHCLFHLLSLFPLILAAMPPGVHQATVRGGAETVRDPAAAVVAGASATSGKWEALSSLAASRPHAPVPPACLLPCQMADGSCVPVGCDRDAAATPALPPACQAPASPCHARLPVCPCLRQRCASASIRGHGPSLFIAMPLLWLFAACWSGMELQWPGKPMPRCGF